MTIRRVWLLIGALTVVFLAGCGDDDADSADPTPAAEQADEQADEESTDDDSANEQADDSTDDDPADAPAPGAAQATFTLGDETWELDRVQCGFGEEETGIEGAEINLAGRSGSMSLYLAVEPGNNYLDWSDLDNMDDPSWESVDDPEVTISGRSVSATASLSDGSETREATLQADCS